MDTVWTYSANDPFVIKIVFQDDYDTEWLVARDQIGESIVSKSTIGEGDFKVQTDGIWFRLFLDVPEGTGVARLITDDVVSFIQATLEIVGPDEDESKIVEAELNDVLSMILSEAKEV
jgi:hypothetical protein